MSSEELSTMTNEELLHEAKALKSFSITNAFIIGFLVGIVLFSIFYSSFGWLMLIPLYLINRFANDPKAKRAAAVERLIRERGLHS